MRSSACTKCHGDAAGCRYACSRCAFTVGDACAAKRDAVFRGSRADIRLRVTAVATTCGLVCYGASNALIRLTGHSREASVLARNLRAIGVHCAGETRVDCGTTRSQVAFRSAGRLAVIVAQTGNTGFCGWIALRFRRILAVSARQTAHASVRCSVAYRFGGVLTVGAGQALHADVQGSCSTRISFRTCIITD